VETLQITMLPILKSWKLLSLLNSEWDMKFYFLHMKSDEVLEPFSNILKQLNENVKSNITINYQGHKLLKAQSLIFVLS